MDPRLRGGDGPNLVGWSARYPITDMLLSVLAVRRREKAEVSTSPSV